MNERKRVFLPLSAWQRKMRVGITGFTELGQAIEESLHDVKKFICADSLGVDIDNLLDFGPDLVFVCHDPVLHASSSRQDATRVEDDFLKLIRRSKAAVVVCTPLTPDVVERMCNTIDDPEDIVRFMYWPNILNQGNVDFEFKNMNFTVIGSRQESVNEFRHFLNLKTDMICPQPVIVNPIEAAYVACAINNFKALKTSFFSELRESVKQDCAEKCDVMTVIKATMSYPIIGRAHAREGVTSSRLGIPESTLEMLTAYTNFTANSNLMKAVADVDFETNHTEINAEEDDEFDNEQIEEKQ